MATATLRRSGGSLILTVPSFYAEQNKLGPGDAVSIDIAGDALTVRPARGRRRYDAAALVAETPAEHMEGLAWDVANPVGREVW